MIIHQRNMPLEPENQELTTEKLKEIAKDKLDFDYLSTFVHRFIRKHKSVSGVLATQFYKPFVKLIVNENVEENTLSCNVHVLFLVDLNSPKVYLSDAVLEALTSPVTCENFDRFYISRSFDVKINGITVEAWRSPDNMKDLNVINGQFLAKCNAKFEIDYTKLEINLAF